MKRALLLAFVALSCTVGPAERHPGACDVTDAGAFPASCPSAWSVAQGLCGKACSDPGLTCAYPGAGDFTGTNECAATAVLQCPGPDGGTPSAGKWTCAQ